MELFVLIIHCFPTIVLRFNDTPGKIIVPSPIFTDLSILEFLLIILSQLTFPKN